MANNPHIEFDLIRQSDPFGGLDGHARAEAVRKVGEEARKLFTTNVTELDRIIHSVNPMQLLAHFAFYDQLWLEGKGDSHGYTPTLQSAVEWLQSLILRVPESEISRVLDNLPKPEVLLKTNALLHETQRAWGMMRIGDKDISPVGLVSEMVRQQTAFVRNEGFPSQIRRLLTGVAKPLDREFERREGFTLTQLIGALYAVPHLVQDRLNEDKIRRHQIFAHRNRTEMIAAFARLNNVTIDHVMAGLSPDTGDLDALRAEMMTWMDTINFRFFFFDVDTFAAALPAGMRKDFARPILDKLSIGFGELATSRPEHLVLENPIWTRPIIHLGNGRYFFPFVSLVQSFGLEMMERFIDPKFSPNHRDLWTRYCAKVRGDYLESRTYEVVRAALPDAQVYRGLKWNDQVDQVEGENDVLALLDTQALVFECKSGRLRALAARGEPKALSGDIEKLMGDPAAQAGRFATFLLRHKNVVRLKDTDGIERELDLTHLKRATTVGVVLDYVGGISTQQRLLRQANLLKADAVPSANMPLHDLEGVLELLDRPAMIFHYLRRRAEIESTTEIMADEHGFLALYLATGFDMGDMEGNPEHRFALPALSAKLEPYFMGREKREAVVKPQMKLRPWWRHMLDQFEKRKFLGWLDASAILLGTNYSGQENFDKGCTKLRRIVRSNWHQTHDDTCIGVYGPKHDRKGLVCLAIKNKERETALETLGARARQAIDQHGAQRILGLIISAEKTADPYLGVYFYEDLENPPTHHLTRPGKNGYDPDRQ